MGAYFKSISFNIGSFIFCVVMFLIYMSKDKKVQSKNRYVYTILSLLILCILGFVFPYTISIRDKAPKLNDLVCRLYLLATYAFAIELFSVVLFATTNSENNPKRKKIFTIFSVIIFLISVGLSMIPKIEYVGGYNNISYCIIGTGMYISHGFVALTIIVESILLFIDKNKSTRVNCFSFLTVLLAYVLIITSITKEGIYANIACVFFSALMLAVYLTFENQDYELLVNYNNAKISSENSGESKTALLSFVYHEIRTYLSVISNYSDLISCAGDVSDEEYNESISGVNTAVRGLGDTINIINVYNQLDNGSIKTESKNYTISDLANRLKSIYPYKMNYDENMPNTLFGDINTIVNLITYLTRSLTKKSNEEDIHVRISGTQKNYDCNMEITIHSLDRVITKDVFEQNSSENPLVGSSKHKIDLNIILASYLIRLLNGSLSFDDINGSKFTIKIRQDIINIKKAGEAK